MIVSHITNGFGNNIFQCVAGKILAEHHETEHYFITETPDYECINENILGCINFTTSILRNK